MDRDQPQAERNTLARGLVGGDAKVAAPRERSTTQLALDNLSDQVQKASSLFTELYYKLEPVLAPVSENKEPGSDRDGFGSSEIHRQIYEIESQVRRLQLAINATAERVEV